MAQRPRTVWIGLLTLALVLAAGHADAVPPDSADFDWTSIPLDVERAKSLGPLETRQPFVRSMAQQRALGRCLEEWVAPPGVQEVHLQSELRLVSEKDFVTVVDVVVLEANPADASLNACYAGKLRRTRHPAPGVASGRRFRIQWGSHRYGL